MADDKATLGKIVKLLTVQKDLIDKLASVTEELDALSGGRAGIGEQIKYFESAWDQAWCTRYSPHMAEHYIWRYVQDRPNIKRLLKSLTVEELSRRAIRFMRCDGPFEVRARHSFALFVASINSWAAEPTAAFRCAHMPPCTSDAQHTRLKAHEMRA